MHRFNSLSISALVLAALFFVVGVVWVVHPTESVWAHPTTDGASTMPQSYVEVVSKQGARMYGVLGMLLGAGLAAFVIFPRRK